MPATFCRSYHYFIFLLLLLPHQASCSFAGIQQFVPRQLQHLLFFAAEDETPDAKLLQPVNDRTFPSTASLPSTIVMMNQSSKRILIEELGFRRQDVDCIRIELVGPIIAKRLQCPPEGMPESWKMQPSNTRMIQRLEQESKYPLKVPLLGVSLILSGKGLSDAIVTAVKVSIQFKGASFTEEFMGVPVLGIDFVCLTVGVALGTWTWQNMKEKGNE
jgi:hypothetical protein